jgi:hypothetical protein
MRKTPIPIFDYVSEQLKYDPETGIVTWRDEPGRRKDWRTSYALKRAGFLNKSHGYRVININYHPELEHQLIWLLMSGWWPAHEIDHEDGVRANNKWSNLRAATKKQQQANRATLGSANKSGIRGVSFDVLRNKWHARIGVDRKTIHLGRFETAELAAAAVRDFGLKIHPEFWRESI